MKTLPPHRPCQVIFLLIEGHIKPTENWLNFLFFVLFSPVWGLSWLNLPLLLTIVNTQTQVLVLLIYIFLIFCCQKDFIAVASLLTRRPVFPVLLQWDVNLIQLQKVVFLTLRPHSFESSSVFKGAAAPCRQRERKRCFFKFTLLGQTNSLLIYLNGSAKLMQQVANVM